MKPLQAVIFVNTRKGSGINNSGLEYVLEKGNESAWLYVCDIANRMRRAYLSKHLKGVNN